MTCQNLCSKLTQKEWYKFNDTNLFIEVITDHGYLLYN